MGKTYGLPVWMEEGSRARRRFGDRLPKAENRFWEDGTAGLIERCPALAVLQGLGSCC
jgi:hypothetical protein